MPFSSAWNCCWNLHSLSYSKWCNEKTANVLSFFKGSNMESLGTWILVINVFADKSYLCVDGKLLPCCVLCADETACRYLQSWNMPDTERLSYLLVKCLKGRIEEKLLGYGDQPSRVNLNDKDNLYPFLGGCVVSHFCCRIMWWNTMLLLKLRYPLGVYWIH